MSLKDFKRFLYVGPSCSSLSDLAASDSLLTKLDGIVKELINGGKGNELLNEITDYYKAYTSNYCNLNKLTNRIQYNLDAIMYALVCSCTNLNKSKDNETYLHKVYEKLNELCVTPVHLFAFEFYRKYLIDKIQLQSTTVAEAESAKQTKNNRKIGRGHKKFLIKWYSSLDELTLLRLITQYKHGYMWSNKDLLKLIHIKPKSDGANLIIKYVLFGYDNVKDEKVGDNEKPLIDFMKDLESLKGVKNGEEIANLIRKNKLNYEHLPSKARKYKEIWAPLVENMNLQEFCLHINLFVKKDLLKSNSPIENYLINNLLNKESAYLKNTNPIFTCLAVQIYEQMTSQRLIKMFNNATISGGNNSNQTGTQANTSSQDHLRDSLWNGFLTSVQHHKAYLATLPQLNQKIMIVIEINTEMRNAHTHGLHFLNPIDTSAAIMLTLYYMNQTPVNLDVFCATDKLNQIELANNSHSQPDLNIIETIFQGFASIENNPTEKIFEWSLQNKKNYDAFIFLSASDSNEKTLCDEMNIYRTKANMANSKLICVNLTGKKTIENDNSSNYLNGSDLNLKLDGWSFDSYFIINSFLSNKF